MAPVVGSEQQQAIGLRFGLARNRTAFGSCTRPGTRNVEPALPREVHSGLMELVRRA